MKNEEDPLWDEPKPNLVGCCYYKLEPLAYLMNNPTTSSIINPNGNCMGTLVSDIIPVDDDGNVFDEIPDDPMELIGQPLNFRVFIKEAKDLPENFCKEVYVEYTSFFDNVANKTKICLEKSKNPVFEEYFEHRIEYLTKDDIDLILRDKVNYLFYLALL